MCGAWSLVHPTPPPLLSICTILLEESISSKPPALFRMVKLFKLISEVRGEEKDGMRGSKSRAQRGSHFG